MCGNRAGALTILLDERGAWNHASELQGEERPTFLVRSLQEVQRVLETELELQPPAAPPQPLD